MANEDDSAPAVWDPTARDGAGGWIRRQVPDAARLHKPSASGPVADGSGKPARSSLPQDGHDRQDEQHGERREAGRQSPQSARTTAPGHAAPPPGSTPAGNGYPQPVPYPPPPAEPPSPMGGAAQPRRSRTPLLVLLVAVLAAAVGAGLVWVIGPGGGGGGSAAAGSPSGTAQGGGPGGAPAPASAAPPSSAADEPTAPGIPSVDPALARAQAESLNELLDRNAESRPQIGNAVATVQSCPAASTLRDTALVFDQEARQLEQQITELDALDVSGLDGGQDTVRSLHTAWQQSAQADRAYGAWADTVISGGCPDGVAPRTADREQADTISAQAGRSKQDFAIKWNPIADRYGLAPRTGDGI